MPQRNLFFAWRSLFAEFGLLLARTISTDFVSVYFFLTKSTRVPYTVVTTAATSFPAGLQFAFQATDDRECASNRRQKGTCSAKMTNAPLFIWLSRSHNDKVYFYDFRFVISQAYAITLEQSISHSSQNMKNKESFGHLYSM